MIEWQSYGSEMSFDLLQGVDPDFYLPPEEVAKRAQRIVSSAKTAVAAFCKSQNSKSVTRTELATHAILLAKLDSIARSHQLDPHFEEADIEDVQDLLEMLAVVPFNQLIDNGPLLLNPGFGETSQIVGGADADLISGDLLVDIKVTKKGEMKVTDLDQLLGYFLLGRHQRSIDDKFPNIKRVAIYFARHGYLWELDAAVWTGHPQFLEIEEWFFKRASEPQSNLRTRHARS